MKKQLILATSLLLASSSLFADYELFTSYTKPKSSISAVKSTVVFSGEYNDYSKQMGKINNGTAQGAVDGVMAGVSSQTATLSSSAGNIAAGAGIGLAAGLLTPIILDMQADQHFIRVVKIEDGKGNFTLKKTMLVCDKNPSLSTEQANEIMKKGK